MASLHINSTLYCYGFYIKKVTLLQLSYHGRNNSHRTIRARFYSLSTNSSAVGGSGLRPFLFLMSFTSDLKMD